MSVSADTDDAVLNGATAGNLTLLQYTFQTDIPNYRCDPSSIGNSTCATVYDIRIENVAGSESYLSVAFTPSLGTPNVGCSDSIARINSCEN